MQPFLPILGPDAPRTRGENPLYRLAQAVRCPPSIDALTAPPREKPMTAPARSQRLLVCNCQRTMEIDGKRLAEALGLPEPLFVHSELCRSQIAAFEAGLARARSVHVACTQEAPLFREVAAREGGRGRPHLHQHPRARRLVRRQARRPAEDGGAAGRGGACVQADRGHHAQVGGRVSRLRPRPGGPRRRRRAVAGA